MAHVNCKFLLLAFKIVSSAIIFIFHLNDQKIRNCKFQTNNEWFNTYFNLQEQSANIMFTCTNIILLFFFSFYYYIMVNVLV